MTKFEWKFERSGFLCSLQGGRLKTKPLTKTNRLH